MKTNTLLLIAAAAAVGLYFVTKPKAGAATNYVSPLPMPPVWQGPIYQPTAADVAVESIGSGIEDSIWAALHTIPIFPVMQ